MRIAADRALDLRSIASQGMRISWASLSGLFRFRPPVRNLRFWATQVLVIGIAAGHDSLEASGQFPHLGMAYLLPVSLFFVPVVYSALYFGLAGALPTALWCTVISTPNWVVFHQGSERIGVISQMLIVDAIAVFVGSRVDQQMKARADAEAASRALQVSEKKYRGLFETAGEGVLVFDRGERIVECNAAAGALLQMPVKALCGRGMGEVLPRGVAAVLREAALNPGGRSKDLLLTGTDGSDTWVEPLCTTFAEQGGLTQVVLRNVTEQKRRQAGLETYAAQILMAQEEERKRVAQELHDETIQSLAILCRMLDDSDASNPIDESQRNVLREAHAYAESLVESVRGFARGLRPPVLDDLGLAPAIDRLLTELDARSGIHGRLIIRGPDRRLPADVELALFRISQEALHNAERHSGASSIRVGLSHQPNSTNLVLADDGKGFVLPLTLDALTNDKKLGLIGMKERARLVGGRLVIRSTPGSGTKVMVTIPCRG